MKNIKNTDPAVNQTINSLDGLQQAEPNEFLAAKAWQRMKERHINMAAKNSRLMLRLAAMLVLFVGINTASFVMLKNKTAQPTQEATGVDAFAEAYSLNNDTGNY